MFFIPIKRMRSSNLSRTETNLPYCLIAGVQCDDVWNHTGLSSLDHLKSHLPRSMSGFVRSIRTPTGWTSFMNAPLWIWSFRFSFLFIQNMEFCVFQYRNYKSTKQLFFFLINCLAVTWWIQYDHMHHFVSFHIFVEINSLTVRDFMNWSIFSHKYAV